MKHTTFRRLFYGSFTIGIISLLLLIPMLIVTQSLIPVYILLGITGMSTVVTIVSLIIASYEKNNLV